MPDQPESQTARLQFVGVPTLFLGPLRRLLSPAEAVLLALPLLRPSLGRSALAELIWPHAADPANSLRQLSYKLRQLAGGEAQKGGSAEGPVLQLPHDLLDPEAAWRADAAALPGELLEGLQWKRQPALAELILRERELWRARRTTALARLADAHQKARRLDEALACRLRLCAEDPLDEARHLELMSLHALRERPDEGAAVAHALRQRLRRARLQPGADLLRLQRQLQGTRVTAAAAPVPVALRLPPRTAGREGLLRELAAARAAGRGVVLSGVAGIGKTRLLNDSLATEPRALAVRLRPADRSTPNAVFVRLLNKLFEIHDDGGNDALAAALNPADRAQLARLLPELGAPGAASAAGLLRAMLACLKQAQVGALGIDDLQHADAESVALLAELVASADAPWCVMALRAGEDTPALRQWLEQPDAGLQRLQVPPLSEAGVAALLRLLEIEQADAAALHRHSGGNALFLLETLCALWDGRRVQVPPGALPVSAHVDELLRERLRGLDPAALQLARLAALADEDLSAALAAELLHVPTLGLTAAWSALESAQVLRGQAFTHDLLRDAVLRDVPEAVRRGTHERIAEHLAQRGGRAAAHRAAAHWAAAARWGQAGAAYREAARHSHAMRRRDDEMRWSTEAVAALERAGEPVALADAQAESIEPLTLTAGPPAALARAELVLAGPASPAARATAALGRLKALMLAARFDAGVAWGDEALRLIERGGNARQLVSAQIYLAQGRAYLGAPAAQILALEKLTDEVTRLADDELEYELVAARSYVLRLAGGDVAAALPLLDRMRALAERLGDVQEQLTALSNSSIQRYELGHLARAHADASRAQALRVRLGDIESVPAGVGQMHLGVMAAGLGRLGEALAALAGARQAFERAGTPAWQRAAELNLALALLHCGQLAQAHKLLAGDWSAATGMHRMGRLLLQARLARWQQRPAGELLAQARQEAEGCQRPNARGLWAIEAACHEPAPEAVAMLQSARAQLASLGSPAHTHLAHGLLIGRLHDIDAAAALDEARAWWAVADCIVNDSLPVWRGLARVFREGGDSERLGQVLQAFRAWLANALAPTLDPAYASTLLERHPDVRALLAECRLAGEAVPEAAGRQRGASPAVDAGKLTPD